MAADVRQVYPAPAAAADLPTGSIGAEQSTAPDTALDGLIGDDLASTEEVATPADSSVVYAISSAYQPAPIYTPPSYARTGCAENGSCYGDINAATGPAKTVSVAAITGRTGPTCAATTAASRPRPVKIILQRWWRSRLERNAAVETEAERLIAQHGALASLRATHRLYPVKSAREQAFSRDVLAEVDRCQPRPRRDPDNHRIYREG